jgi:hypothetical protein
MGRTLASSLVVAGLSIVGTVSAQQPAPAAPAALDGATYSVRLRDIESKVDGLKENLRRSQARLTLLSDTVLSGGASGCRAEVDFVNDIQSGLDLVGVTITIDGVVQLNKQDENGGLMVSRSYPVLRAAVQPGDHTVQVKLSYRGSKGGLFSYMSAFRADVKGSHTFATSEGKSVRLKILASERGGFFAPLESSGANQRLGLEWPETSEKLQSEAPAKAEGTNP